MKVGLHIYGRQTAEIAKVVNIPKACFYHQDAQEPTLGPKDELGIIIETFPIPRWVNLSGIQFKDNSTRKENINCKYLIYYGDVRDIRGSSIPIVCDLMDENLWYYFDNLTTFGLLTMGINADESPLNVVVPIIQTLGQKAEFVRYSDLL